MIIALAHTGIGDAKVSELEENAAYDLTNVEGIDAIISGHSHSTFPGSYRNLPGVDSEKGTINGVPVVMAGSWGSHLGVIDLKIKKEKGKWVVKNSESELRAIYDKTNKISLAEPDNRSIRSC